MSDPLADLAEIRQSKTDPLADLAALRGSKGRVQTKALDKAGLSGADVKQLVREGLPNTLPAPPEKAKPGFWRGVWDTTGAPLVDAVKENVAAVKNPAHDPLLAASNLLPGLGPAAVQGIRGIVSGAQQEGTATGEALSRGEYSQAAGHGLASVLPILGPAAAGIAEELPNNPAHAAGMLTGLAAPDLVMRGLAKLPNIKAVSPPPGVATGLPGFIERTTAGGVPFGEFRDAQFEAAMNDWQSKRAALDLHERQMLNDAQKTFRDFHEHTTAAANAAADSLAAKPNLTPKEANTIAASEVMERKSAAQDQYNAVTKATEGVPIDIEPVQKAAARWLGILEERSGLIDPKLIGPLRDQLQALVDADKQTTYAAASGAASDILDTARKLDEPLQNLRGKINTDLAAALKQSIDKSVTGADPQIGQMLKEANKTWGRIHAPAVRDFLEAAEANPERAHEILTKPSTTAADIKALQQVMSPESFRAMSAMALRDMLDAVTARGKMHESPMLGEITSYDEFSGPKLLDKLDTMRRAGTADLLLPKATQDLLTQLANAEMEQKNPTVSSIAAKTRGAGEALAANKPVRSEFNPKSSLASDAFNRLLQALGIGGGASAGFLLGHGGVGAVVGGSAGYLAGNVGLSALARTMLNPAGANKVLAAVRAFGAGAKNATALAQQVSLQIARDAERKKKVAPAASSVPGPPPLTPPPPPPAASPTP